MELHDAEEAMGIRKQESTNQGGHFLDLQGFSWSYAHPKVNLHSCKKNYQWRC